MVRRLRRNAALPTLYNGRTALTRSAERSVTLRREPQPMRPEPVLPKPGDVYVVDDEASVQFAGLRHLIFRVGKVRQGTTYRGWVWLKGYVLDSRGEATEQREIFVQVAGLKPTQLPTPPNPKRSP
jgi:hypothetical protein